MGHPMGAHFHLPHGVACGLLLPPVMRYNLIAAPQRYIDLAMGLEGRVQGQRELEKAYCAVEAVERLMHDIHMQVDFSTYDINAALLSQMAEETLNSGMHLTNPRKAVKSDVIKVFEDLFKGTTIEPN
jgi:alcohol dehydrogenase